MATHSSTQQPCQRWRLGRTTYRPAGEPIDPSAYTVELILEASAKAFVCQHHYSRSFPAARLRVGLFHRSGVHRSALVGVAVFSVPMAQTIIPKYTNLQPHTGIELGRFVLLDAVPANAESFFLARAFTLLHTTLSEVQAVLAYADPVPRTLADGTQLSPGHMGIIYQATNASYVGRSKPRTLILSPDRTVLSDRTLSKLRNEERGADGAYRQLRSYGCPPRRAFESGQAYLQRVLAPFTRLRHPGNHAYLWALGGPAARRQIRHGFVPGRPYPKCVDQL